MNRPTQFRGLARSKDTRGVLLGCADRELTQFIECRMNTALVRRAGQQLDDQGVVAEEGLPICTGIQGEHQTHNAIKIVLTTRIQLNEVAWWSHCNNRYQSRCFF